MFKLSELQMEDVTQRCYRQGKTLRDKVSGAWHRRRHNQQARAAWMNRTVNNEPFPTHTCNGHRYYRGGNDSHSERAKLDKLIKAGHTRPVES